MVCHVVHYKDTVERAGSLEKDNAAGSSQWEESESGNRRVVRIIMVGQYRSDQTGKGKFVKQ